jgi:hypothetical protein
MPIITGGNIVPPIAAVTLPGERPRVVGVSGVPTDANVGGGYRTPGNGELATDVTNGNMYERQAGVWTRIDTI